MNYVGIILDSFWEIHGGYFYSATLEALGEFKRPNIHPLSKRHRSYQSQVDCGIHVLLTSGFLVLFPQLQT